MNFKIRPDDLRGSEIIRLLEEHLEHMHEITPPESIHALDLDGLRLPEITFWSVWEADDLLGCGALKELSVKAGEVKSMRVKKAHRGKGVAKKMLEHIITEAVLRGYTQLYLETGAMPEFEPARKLYERFGFVYGEPFADYTDDPNSVFMTKALSNEQIS